MVMLMPGIGERFIFSRGRLSLAFFIALVILPIARPSLRIPQDLAALMTLLVGEVLIGLIIGVCARLVMAALQTAGTIVAQAMGLGFAMTVDPTAGAQNPSIEICSARSVGLIPAATRRSSISGVSPFSAARSILRRWLNALATTRSSTAGSAG